MSAITINIDGSTYTVDPSEIGKINDISADMEVVSAEIAFHGRLLGAAERQIEQMDARYRQWRAESVNNILASDPKMAEWKVKAAIECQPEFIKLQSLKAQSLELKTALYWVCQALKQKAEMLRSIGATERSQMQTAGMTTRKRA